MEKSRAAARSPEIRFALLGVAVLAIHVLLLQGVAFQLGSIAPPITRPFITRTLPAVLPPVVRKPAPTARVARKTSPPAPVSAPLAPAISDSGPAEQAASASISVAPGDGAATPGDEPAVAAPASGLPAPPVAEAPRAAPVSLPGSMRLNYRITGEVRQLTYTASGELLWLHDGKTYDARMEVGAFLLGSRVQTSRGLITAEGLAPTRFGDKVRSEVAAHFERDKGKIIFSANTPEVALQPGAQDQLSIFIQLASLIGGDPARYPKGSTLEMQAVGPRDAETWRFVVDGEELLQLPVDTLTALKLTRLPQKTYDITAELWLAPSMGYLPVRIRLTQNNDDFIDQQLRSSEPP